MNKNVLIIGNDANMLNTLEFLLESENFVVYTTICDEKKTDIEQIYSNIELVIADTLTSARRCSALLEPTRGDNGQIPMIVLTDIFEKGKTLKNIKGKNVTYIEKPFSVFDLIEMIKGIFNTEGNA